MQAELQQLTRNPPMAPTWILAGEAQDELSHPILDGRTARTSPPLRPLPPHEFAMPAQKGLRRHDQLSPPTREHSGERREKGTIGRSERGARLLPAEHYELMSQHEQLDVFVELAAPASDQQPQNSREREISEGEKHPPMLPEPTSGSGETWNLGFETPHADIPTSERIAPPNGGT